MTGGPVVTRQYEPRRGKRNGKAPAGNFDLTLRLYRLWPILDGSYRLPAIKRLDEEAQLGRSGQRRLTRPIFGGPFSIETTCDAACEQSRSKDALLQPMRSFLTHRFWRKAVMRLKSRLQLGWCYCPGSLPTLISIAE
jgi:hypothetical protein